MAKIKMIETEEFKRIDDLSKHFGFSLVPYTDKTTDKLRARIIDNENDKVIEIIFARFMSGEVEMFDEQEHFKLTKGQIFDKLFDYKKPILTKGD